MTSQVETPPDLAGGTFESTIRSKAKELKQELIKQTLQDLESWAKAMNMQWEQAHPNHPPSTILHPTVDDGHPGGFTTQVDPYIGQTQKRVPDSEVQQYANVVRTQYYEWVEPAFERYLKPDPDATNPMIDNLRTIESMFQGSQDDAGHFSPASPALSRINDVRTDMSHWQGDLQTNFIDNFVTPLQTVSLNQAAVAKATREVLELNKVIYIRYRRGILNLVNDSIEAVKTLNNGRDPKSYMWGTLVGISIGTVLTLGTAGVAAVGAGLIVASTLAQGLVPDPPKTNELSAPTAQEVAVKVGEAMSAMDTDIYEKGEKQIEQAFRDLKDQIASSRSSSIGSNTSGPLAVAMPAVSTAKPGDITDGSLRPEH